MQRNHTIATDQKSDLLFMSFQSSPKTNCMLTADSGWVFNDVSYRIRYHGWLVALQGKLSGVARLGWYHSVWEKARHPIDLYVMVTEIKIEYSYYSTKRITPVYIVEEELMSLEYSKFVERFVNEVPHLRRMNSLRLTVKEDETVNA